RRNRSRAVRRLLRLAEHVVGNGIGAKNLDFLVSHGNRCYFSFMPRRAGSDALDAKLGTRVGFHRERPAVATGERLPFLAAHSFAHALLVAPRRAGGVPSPTLTATDVALRTLRSCCRLLVLLLGLGRRA